MARRCLLPLLAQFPTRSRPNQRGALSDMLHAALNLPLPERAARAREGPRQCADDGRPAARRWLAAGLLLDADHYLPLVTCYLGKRPPSVDAIAGFLHYRREIGDTTSGLSSNVLGVLIEHFAVGCSPARITGAGRVTSAMNRAEQVRRFINDLAGRADADSTEQLARLESLPALTGWVNDAARGTCRPTDRPARCDLRTSKLAAGVRDAAAREAVHCRRDRGGRERHDRGPEGPDSAQRPEPVPRILEHRRAQEGECSRATKRSVGTRSPTSFACASSASRSDARRKRATPTGSARTCGAPPARSVCRSRSSWIATARCGPPPQGS